MKQSVTKELHAYWSALKVGRLAPERNEIDLAAIRHLLANVFFLQVDMAGSYPLKMCGTRISAFWLADRKGRSFLDLWDDRARPTIATALSAVTEDVRAVVASARSGGGDMQRLDLELLLLPLRCFGKTNSLVLGALTPVNEPDWLGRRAAPPLQVNSTRALGAEESICGGCMSRARADRPRLVLHEGGKSGSMLTS